MKTVIPVGISSCLLGNEVRYDGGHKRDRYVTDTLSRYFRFVAVCPEVECGLSVPREAMRLVGHPEGPRLRTIRSGVDYTSQMLAFCREKVEALDGEDLCGFIFKSDSPSSGLYRVKIYDDKGNSVRNGRGLFASAVAERFPLLPLEEEGRLHDARLRENFIERVFSYHRWKQFKGDGPGYRELIAFHTNEKLLLMSHSPRHYAVMGRLVAGGKAYDRVALLAQYEGQFMEALAVPSSVKKNVNVLQHVMGYFRDYLSADEKAELLELIRNYADSLVPLTVPLTLINHYVRKYDVDYLKEQVYLSPHPAELMLRNHV
jgi:uncharacterized protein YbgA (DUF1722 family)/uncharacterized protein YbbK (DUF523 family)